MLLVIKNVSEQLIAKALLIVVFSKATYTTFLPALIATSIAGRISLSEEII